MDATVSVILEGRSYLECPRWHHDDDGTGRIWVSDFYTHEVISARPDGSDVRVEAVVENQPSGLGWLPDGRLLIVSMLDRKILRREHDGELVLHAEVSDHATGHLNDMIVDDQGRAYVGNFGFDLMNMAPIETANIVRADLDGTVTVVATDLYFPNGMVLTAGGELLVDETLGNRVSAFSVASDGSLGERRTWAKFGELPDTRDMAGAIPQSVVAADGCAGDPDGTMWIADALGQRVVHVGATGEIVDELTFDTGVFACGLGGDDGRTLFVCAAPDFSEHARKVAREASLLAVRV